MSPDGIQPGVLEEVADIIARLLLVIFEKSWCSEKVSKCWKNPATMRCLVWWMRAEWEMLCYFNFSESLGLTDKCMK